MPSFQATFYGNELGERCGTTASERDGIHAIRAGVRGDSDET